MTNSRCDFIFDTPEAFRNAFSSNCKHIFEINAQLLSASSNATQDDEFRSIHLFSNSAYKTPVSQSICHEIRSQYPDISRDLLQNINTALHEAISNAVIHGNLEISKSFKTADELSKADVMIKERLATAEYGDKPVIIRYRHTNSQELLFEITNQGNGFDYKPIVTKTQSLAGGDIPAKHHGMGLPLIASLSDRMEFSDEGRTLSLHFKMVFASPKENKGSFNYTSLENRADFKVVIVDDMEYNRHIVHDILFDNGFRNIISAGDAREAISLVNKTMPSLIISNMNLEGMQGDEFCRIIRSNPSLMNVPIILHAAMARIEQRIEVFECGASDLIEQPINDQELIVRIEMHLSRYLAYQKLQEYRNRVESEIELARQMHLTLIPPKEQIEAYRQSHGLAITDYFHPSSEIGGDVWGVFDIDEHKVGIYICDFTGHGVGAAINTFRFHTAVQSIKTKADPGTFLTDTNKILCDMLPVTQFATFFYAVIDSQSETMCYAAAGAPKPYLHSQKTGEVEQIDSSGMPLGIVADKVYETLCQRFNKGDSILLYSDALVETPDSIGNFIQEDDLAKYVKEYLSDNPANNQKKLIRQLLSLLGVFEGRQCDDDLTLTIFTRD